MPRAPLAAGAGAAGPSPLPAGLAVTPRWHAGYLCPWVSGGGVPSGCDAGGLGGLLPGPPRWQHGLLGLSGTSAPSFARPARLSLCVSLSPLGLGLLALTPFLSHAFALLLPAPSPTGTRVSGLALLSSLPPCVTRNSEPSENLSASIGSPVHRGSYCQAASGTRGTRQKKKSDAHVCPAQSVS